MPMRKIQEFLAAPFTFIEAGGFPFISISGIAGELR
jgi:hypothetical protein